MCIRDRDLPARNAFSIADVGRFSQDEYIKKYLDSPDLPFITVIKIGFRYSIIGHLILKLDELQNRLKIVHLHTFMQVFGSMVE